MESLEQIGIKAKKASRYLAKLGIDEKNKALEAVFACWNGTLPRADLSAAGTRHHCRRVKDKTV